MQKIKTRKHNLCMLFMAFVALIGCYGCDDELPKDIIQPSDLENILYDYHLANTLATTKSDYREEYKKQALREYVFQKHKITPALFDTSMIWYTRHSTRLSEIYDNLSKRFDKEFKHLSSLLGDNNKQKITASGDTVDVWSNSTLCWLTGNPLNNKLQFIIPSDSNFVAKDSFVWAFDAILLAASAKATMSMNIIFANDSVIGLTRKVLSSGKTCIGLKSDSAYAIKQVTGYVYLDKQPDGLGILLNNISLTRYHPKKVGDSLLINQLSQSGKNTSTSIQTNETSLQRTRKLENKIIVNKKMPSEGKQQLKMD